MSVASAPSGHDAEPAAHFLVYLELPAALSSTSHVTGAAAFAEPFLAFNAADIECLQRAGVDFTPCTAMRAILGCKGDLLPFEHHVQATGGGQINFAIGDAALFRPAVSHEGECYS